MKNNINLLSGYDNSTLMRYSDLEPTLMNTHYFDEIGGKAIEGVLKASFHRDGKLIQMYSECENHVGVIAATRLGKTTSYVIPTILSFARQKIKRPMIISDPKGEVYRYTAAELKKQGYEIKLLNFRNYLNSDCWNMLTPIYRKYIAAMRVADEVEIVENDKGEVFNSFRGKVYKNQKKLDEAIATVSKYELDIVGNDIDAIANIVITTQKKEDPYWEDSARDLLKAFLWAMLEDTQLEKNPITEDTFSFSTIISIMSSFKGEGNSSKYDDRGYFSSRPSDSTALALAMFTILDNAPNTRRCVISSFNLKMSVFKDVVINRLTSCNSFDLSEFNGDKPVALFIVFRDEVKLHYQIISIFVQDAYKFLIEEATKNPSGKLNAPFYFILDEFGNFPQIKDFETTISACAGRNIWFILIIQSYAQLDSVYREENAKIIRDNLNMHVFFGSNNPATLEEFSKECGNMTRISPLSALNGEGKEISNYSLDTIPLIPKSRLAHFEQGECIITEANCGYVLFSKLERYYTCKEFNKLQQSSTDDYVVKINPLDQKYEYRYKGKPTRRNFSFFE